MDPQITAAIIGGAATLVTGAIAVWAVVWQIGKQAGLAVQQSAHNARISLKLEVYRSIASECEEQQDRISPVLSRLTAFKWRLPTHFEDCGYLLPVGVSGPELLDLIHKVQSGTADLLILLERWEIIDPRLDLFRSALNSASHNLRQAWDEFSPVALFVLPPSVEQQADWPPQPDKTRELVALIPTVESALHEMTSYIHDLRVEMQNLLLSELFTTRAQPRIPLDPKQFAVSFDRYDELKSHFRNDTAWGRHLDKVNEDARRIVADRERKSLPDA